MMLNETIIKMCYGFDNGGFVYMNIRKATVEDINGNLLDLYMDGFQYHAHERPDIFFLKNKNQLKDELIAILKEFHVLVLERDGKILGFACYKIKNVSSKVLWLDYLVIDKNYRGLGYGKMIMDALKEIARDSLCSRVELCCWSFNQNAMEIYKNIGFDEQRIIFEMKL